MAQAHKKGYDSLFYRSLLNGYRGDRDALSERFSTDCVTMLIGSRETMRFESPLQMGRRRAAAPVEFLGREFNVGDNILLCLGSANRDETVFEDAARFIPGRKNAQRQLGFGTGTHQCIGQLLAQCQAESLAIALNHHAHIILDVEAKGSKQSLILRSLESLPVKIIRSDSPGNK